MKNSGVACIIANYNNCTYLKECVMSVIDQSVKVDEIIIADDASTDRSKDIIEELAAKYENIRPILRTENLGVSRNRHLAILSSNSPYITTLDSDDCFYPGKIEAELLALQQNDGDIAYSDIVLIDQKGENVKHIALDGFANSDQHYKITTLIGRKNPIPRDMLFTRKAYDDVGGFSSQLKVYEDLDLKLRLAFLPEIKWVYSNAPGTAYRIGSDGLSRKRPLINMMKLFSIIFSQSSTIVQKIGFADYFASLFELSVYHLQKVVLRLKQ